MADDGYYESLMRVEVARQHRLTMEGALSQENARLAREVMALRTHAEATARALADQLGYAYRGANPTKCEACGAEGPSQREVVHTTHCPVGQREHALRVYRLAYPEAE